jgi:predicted regulator of Ras-like GTPase activity (Roadblock/LC7/MglB family)
MTPHDVNQGGELNWLLDDLVNRVPQVSKAVMLTQDGLAIGASSSLNREDAEHLAALAAGFQSMARGAGQHFGGGRVRQTIIEMEAAFLFVSAAGQGTCLAVLSTGDADVGLVGYEMAVLVGRSNEHLGVAPRPAGYPQDYPGYAQEQPQQRPPSMAGSGGTTPPFPAQPQHGTPHGGPRCPGPAAAGTASPYLPGRRMSPPSMGTASAPLARLTPQPRDAASPDSVYSPHPTPAGRPPSAPYTE